jgi:hypothetical protein
MKTVDVLVVRIYITESSNLLSKIVKYLQKEVNIRGISVFRAVSGFGESGSHGAALIDMSLDLPLAIEFFDDKEKVEPALEHLKQILKPEHIVFWPAQANV